MVRSLSTAVAVIAVLAIGCAQVAKVRKAVPSEQTPPATSGKTPQTSSSGSK